MEGGCANDYTYVHGDPVNTYDLSGTAKCPKALRKGAEILGYGFVARTAGRLSKKQFAKAVKETFGGGAQVTFVDTAGPKLLENGAKALDYAIIENAGRVIGKAFFYVGIAATAVDAYCTVLSRLDDGYRGSAINGTNVPGAPGGFYNPGMPS